MEKIMVQKAKKTASKNVANRAANVVSSDALKVKENQLAKTISAFEKAKSSVVSAKQKYDETANKAKQNGRAASVKVAENAKQALSAAMVKRDNAAESCKAARDALQKTKRRLSAEERAKREEERKEAAKQRAIATFVRKWEREWDKKVRMANKPKRQAVQART
jgi:hypothetical protein